MSFFDFLERVMLAATLVGVSGLAYVVWVATRLYFKAKNLASKVSFPTSLPDLARRPLSPDDLARILAAGNDLLRQHSHKVTPPSAEWMYFNQWLFMRSAVEQHGPRRQKVLVGLITCAVLAPLIFVFFESILVSIVGMLVWVFLIGSHVKNAEKFRRLLYGDEKDSHGPGSHSPAASDEIQKLYGLHKSGAISQSEFEEGKRNLLRKLG